MQKKAVFHLISKNSLRKIPFVFSLWIINEFEKYRETDGKSPNRHLCAFENVALSYESD